MDKLTIRDIDVAGKTVLVRVDFNVPRDKDTGEITDDNRVVAALPTINYLLDHNPKAVVLFSHLGKIKKEEDKAKNDMAVVAPKLAELLGRDVKFVNATRGAELEEAVKNAENGQVILVQNTRYEAGETKNDPELGAYWASLGDVFVEDAFGSVHRAHASTVGIAAHLPAVAGFLVEKEIAYIGKAVSDPERPLVAILGGSKVSSKIGVIENLLNIADKIIIGGGMCYTFAKAQGHTVGSSLVEEDKVDLAKSFIEKGGDKLILPIDSVVSSKFGEDGDIKVVGEDAYFLAWTTTPWTLPSNVALCVNPDETYCKVKAADGYTYYMAEALLDKVLGKLGNEEEGVKAYEVLETYTGKDLEYKEYEPLYACAAEVAAKQHKKGHFVTCDTYVTMSDGTGIVHIAPAFGEDDANVGRKYDLPFVQFVNGKGEMTEETPYAGLFVKKADPEVLKDLDAQGKLFDAPKFEHEYPHCWRCDTPLIYYARESWFIKMTDP